MHSKGRGNSIKDLVPSQNDSSVNNTKTFISRKVATKKITEPQKKNVRTVPHDSRSMQNSWQPVRTYSCRSHKSLAIHKNIFSSQQQKIAFSDFTVPKIPMKNARLQATCDDTGKSVLDRENSAFTEQQNDMPCRRNIFSSQQKHTDVGETCNDNIFDRESNPMERKRKNSIFERNNLEENHHHQRNKSFCNNNHLPVPAPQHDDYKDRLEKIDAFTNKLIKRAKCIENTATKLQLVDSLCTLSSAVSELCFDGRVPSSQFHGVANHSVANHGVANHGVANHGVANHGVANHCNLDNVDSECNFRPYNRSKSKSFGSTTCIQQSGGIRMLSLGFGQELPRPDLNRVHSKRSNSKGARSIKDESILNERRKKLQMRRERLRTAVTSDVKVTSLLLFFRLFSFGRTSLRTFL